MGRAQTRLVPGEIEGNGYQSHPATSSLCGHGEGPLAFLGLFSQSKMRELNSMIPSEVAISS